MPAPLALLLRVIEHSALLMVPALAAGMWAARRGASHICVLGAAALAGIGAAGYTAFWLWFLSPLLGKTFSFLLIPAAISYFVWGWRRLDSSSRNRFRVLGVPALLALAASVLVLGVGFLYGGVNHPSTTAAARFSHQLPLDNDVPFVFAEQIRSGYIRKPMFQDWHSSDRPPLQTGIALSQYPFIRGPRVLGCMVLGVDLQCLAIFALWLFLTALNVDRRAAALALAVALFSGFFLINAFYVWPKLLAAAYMLVFSALLLGKGTAREVKGNGVGAVVAGATLGFGLLAHGGSAFAVLGLILAMLVLRKRRNARNIALVALSSAVLYVPWVLYQKLYDPPGDRLLKWHLAGVINVDKRSFSEDLKDSYARLTWPGILEVREVNARLILGSQSLYWLQVKNMLAGIKDRSRPVSSAQAASILRDLQFFQFALALGFMMGGPFFLLLGMVRRYRSALWRTSAEIWTFVLCTLISWCLLMFFPGKANVHQGTYVAVLLAFAGSVLAIWAFSPRLALILAVAQVAFTILLYGVYCKGAGYSGLIRDKAQIDWGELALALAALALICAVLACMAGLTTRKAVPGLAAASAMGSKWI